MSRIASLAMIGFSAGAGWFLFSCSLRSRNLVNLVDFYKVSLASLAMEIFLVNR